LPRGGCNTICCLPEGCGQNGPEQKAELHSLREQEVGFQALQLHRRGGQPRRTEVEEAVGERRQQPQDPRHQGQEQPRPPGLVTPGTGPHRRFRRWGLHHF